jgi:hypothetical protein
MGFVREKVRQLRERHLVSLIVHVSPLIVVVPNSGHISEYDDGIPFMGASDYLVCNFYAERPQQSEILCYRGV